MLAPLVFQLCPLTEQEQQRTHLWSNVSGALSRKLFSVSTDNTKELANKNVKSNQGAKVAFCQPCKRTNEHKKL